MIKIVVAVLLGAFLNRVRGGASRWLARHTPVPLAMWRYGSFIGFGTLLAGLTGMPLPWAMLFALGMWQVGARLGGWTGVFADRLGLHVPPERWQVGPLRHSLLAAFARGGAWGFGGIVVTVPVAWLLRGMDDAGVVAQQGLGVALSLAAAFAIAPSVVRMYRRGRWTVDNGFVFSWWGVMELAVGAAAAFVAYLVGISLNGP